MPASLQLLEACARDPDLLLGRGLVEFWVSKKFVDDDEWHRASARFYAAARAGKIPVSKVDGVWVSRRSTIEQYRRSRLEEADRLGRERVGMVSPT
jgi:hypothetical protein